MSFSTSTTPKYGPDSVLPKQKLFINGHFVDATSDDAFDTINPATNKTICSVQQASQQDIDKAVSAARDAFPAWAATPARERGTILRRAAKILLARNEELAALETLDTGKAISETQTVDIITGVEVLEYYAGIAPTLHGDYFDHPPTAFSIIHREPLGVCAGIGAWNYPIQIAMWKSAPALACGNTMVFKPAELTPLSALALADIYCEAGVPNGVFNVVQGDARIGRMLSLHPGIDKVSLTGEAGTGKKVMADAATTLKHVTFELGGKSPLLIFADADIESAVSAALVANFFSTGQVCSNGTRVFVERSVIDEFITRLRPRVEAMRVGCPFDPQTQVGPLVSTKHWQKVMSYMDDAFASAATHVTGGQRPTDSSLTAGNYVLPAVFADCDDNMRFVREEVFGPLMSILTFDNEEEVLARANATDYGLAAAVFSRDFSRAHRLAQRLQAGTVWINDYNTLPPEVPFGGVKGSGIGRENGLQAVEHYTQTKTVYANTGDFKGCY
ncbi:betaine-aldehyde dehydrogenase [Candidatus Persebacteraceae bacterium Df01]|jgi:betaine-aldehyde dehydrogenase|uniref:Betaine-aldehyde dehydrogenase n=1 Tax=Candidatus Doriopsillibacter californiensis TaxID=2970740 RepID=A0ABT7QLI0_9GAMM|nr:betaine-aldehyde dehydrogenase [Candidatus Persebacteraceae bacterium Df01]